MESTEQPDQTGELSPLRTIIAPWTDEQVETLNKFQRSGVFHPFTCANRGDGKHGDYGIDLGVLVATKDGWTCPWCDYTQTWAHAAMADDAFIAAQQQSLHDLFGRLSRDHSRRADTEEAEAAQADPQRSEAVPVISADLTPTAAWWGMHAKKTEILTFETQVGRKFDLTYFYYDFSDSGSNGQPLNADQKSLSDVRIPMISYGTSNWSTHAVTMWAQIAASTAGDPIDRKITDVAARVKTIGKPCFLVFEHEMQANLGKLGTAEDFKRCWRHVRQRFLDVGATNAVWVWCISMWFNTTRNAMFTSLYPGDDVVDWVAHDPYNHDVSRWASFYDTVAPGYKFLAGLAPSKPQMLCEYGTVTDPANPQRASDWFAGIPAALTKMPKMRSLCYFSSDSTWDTRLTTAMIPGFTAAGRDPALNQAH